MASPTTNPRSPVFLARQPILDRTGRVRAYELLYRTTDEGPGRASSTADAATARVLHGAIMSLGLDAFSPDRPAFINLTRNLLLGDLAEMLPKDSVVFEVLETVDADREVIEACRRLHASGHTLALDDFVPGSSAEELLPYVKYLKVDVRAIAADARRRLIASAPDHLTFLAEKVETADEFAATTAEGFTLFQGYYFCRPTTVRTHDISGGAVASLRVLEAVNRPSVTLNELDDIIRRDASLAQRVLRYANSAAVGRRQTTGSIRQALLVVGLDQIRRWVSVWSLAGLGASHVPEVMTMAVVRARCCERLGAAVLGEDQSGECFVLGLCSLLDVLLGGPMEDVLKVLSLPDESVHALTGGRNTRRDVLDAVVAYERGQWPAVQQLCADLRIRSADLAEFHADATRWAGELTDTRR